MVGGYLLQTPTEVRIARQHCRCPAAIRGLPAWRNPALRINGAT
jgi:hypothetical protein